MHVDSYERVRDQLIYCTRTVVEMEKTIEEVKFILEERRKEKPNEAFKFLCTGLSARYHELSLPLCLTPSLKGVTCACTQSYQSYNLVIR